MDRGRWAMRSALKTGLRSINGSAGGYWYDYSNRVFDKLLSPAESAEVPDYYLCIPRLDETDTPDEQDQRSVKRHWQQTIWGFARETKDDPLDSGAVEIICKMQDDLDRYFQTDPTLGGAVLNVRQLPAHDTAAEGDYGEFAFPVEITQLTSPLDLGPDA